MKSLIEFDGQLYLVQRFYNAKQAKQLFDLLLQDLAWQEEQIFIYGRWVKVPRMMCWYGDKNVCYQYSGVNHQALSWTKTLLAVRKKIEIDYQCTFNSVMANLYRNGADSMGCHADNEKELGVNPFIASLSLGESRLIKFRHIKIKKCIDVVLGHGDLLLMAGEIQHYWRHEVPKTKKPKAERINLTYRKIINVA